MCSEELKKNNLGQNFTRFLTYVKRNKQCFFAEATSVLIPFSHKTPISLDQGFSVLMSFRYKLRNRRDPSLLLAIVGIKPRID